MRPYPPLSSIRAISRWISMAKAASLGKSEKDALQLAKMSSSLPPPSLVFRPLHSTSRHGAHSHIPRLSLVFRRSNTGWIGSTESTKKTRERRKRRRRRRRRNKSLCRESECIRAVMHWRRRHVKLSFSHNSLESLPLNLVIGRAIVIRMLYRLPVKKRDDVLSYLFDPESVLFGAKFFTPISRNVSSLNNSRLLVIRF